MQDRKLPNTPDLASATVAFLGINLTWILFVVWILYGMIPVLVLAVFINHLIDRLEERLDES